MENLRKRGARKKETRCGVGLHALDSGKKKRKTIQIYIYAFNFQSYRREALACRPYDTHDPNVVRIHYTQWGGGINSGRLGYRSFRREGVRREPSPPRSYRTRKPTGQRWSNTVKTWSNMVKHGINTVLTVGDRSFSSRQGLLWP